MKKLHEILHRVNQAREMFTRACEVDGWLYYDVASVLLDRAASELQGYTDASERALSARYAHLVRSLRDDFNVAIARRDDRKPDSGITVGRSRPGVSITETQQAIRAFWIQNLSLLGSIPRPMWDELDSLIRADERAHVLTVADGLTGGKR